jgi:hypothetical protein
MSTLFMSKPAASDPVTPQVDPEIGLMFTAADHLIPLFKTGSIDVPLARQMAVSAIEAYRPETRADFVNVARTIAFSMAALALLGQTTSADMTLPEKMRAFGRANALSRSADQSERTMMQRRRYQQTNPPAEHPDPKSEHFAPDTLIDDAKLQADIAGAMREYLAARTRPSPRRQGSSQFRPHPGPPRQNRYKSRCRSNHRKPRCTIAAQGQAATSRGRRLTKRNCYSTARCSVSSENRAPLTPGSRRQASARRPEAILLKS